MRDNAGIMRSGPGRLCKGALVSLAVIFCVCLVFQTKAYAAEPVMREIEVDSDLCLTVQVDEGGTLQIQEAELEGEALPLDAEIIESREVLIALAAAHNGWYKSNSGDWYYFVNGKWTVGWKAVDGYWYLFDNAGRMLKGWQSNGGNWYYLRTATNVPNAGPEGSMVVGWLSNGGYWYKLNDSGAMMRGFHADGGYWYYFRTANNVPVGGPDGAMVANCWIEIAGECYAFQPGGQMRTGWFDDGDHRYFLANSEIGIGFNSADYGKMVLGLCKIGLYEYFFNDPANIIFFAPDGAMIRNNPYFQFLTPDGIIVAGIIDGNGHVHRTGIKSLNGDAPEMVDTRIE